MSRILAYANVAILNDNFISQTNLSPRQATYVEQEAELPHEGVLVAEELNITPSLHSPSD